VGVVVPLPWFAHYAFRQLFPAHGHRRFTFAAAAGVAIGVAVLIVVLSVMDGFQWEIRRRLLQLHGEVAVLGEGSAFAAVDAWKERLEAMDQILEANPFYETFALAEFGGKYALPLALGLDGEAFPEGFAVVGAAVAEQLGTKPGDEMLIADPQTFLRNGEGEVQLPLPLNVLGSMSVRSGEMDGRRILLSRESLSRLFGEENCASGYEIKLAKGVEGEKLVEKLNGGLLPPFLRAMSWIDMNGELLSVLAMERAAMFFSMACIVVVTAFSMGSFLAAHVARLSREIGALRAMGCSGMDIGLTFVLQSVLIGFLGSCGGVAAGWALLHFRDGVLSFLVGAFGGGERLLSFYSISGLPALWRWSEVAKVCSMAVAVTAAAGLVPAIRSMGTEPSLALRHE
jgi:lipoprotein-releasing system permease protein